MRKREILTFEIPNEYLLDVLDKAGYDLHWNGESYIKELYNKKRFHIYPKQGFFEIHLDRTINDHHIVADDRWLVMLYTELKAIKKIWKDIDPERKERIRLQNEAIARKKEKRVKRKGEFAPNLMELQRRASLLNKSPQPQPIAIDELEG